MKAIVGVDHDGLYESALNLLGRLGLGAVDVELLNMDEPILAYPSEGGMLPTEGFTYAPEVEEVRQETAHKVLAVAVDKAKALGLNVVRQEYVLGPVTASLIDAAEADHADLVAVGSHQKSEYGSLFLGSVGRGLSISCKKSVLIAKGRIPATGPITAVFATDYSEYSKEALYQFARIHPAGVTRLILVSAVRDVADEPTVMQTVESESLESRFFKQEAATAVAHLAEKGITAEVHIAEGEVHGVIEAAMRDFSADLLIMGAHGHGFFERLFLGSVSLQQTLATHHPVLILRPRK